MKCPYTTACERCGLQNSENCNTCESISKNADCIQVNTSGMTQDTPCHKCKMYNHGVIPTGAIPRFFKRAHPILIDDTDALGRNFSDADNGL